MSAQKIRAARPEDRSALTALWATAFTPPLAPDQWLIDDDRLAHTLVAEDDRGPWARPGPSRQSGKSFVFQGVSFTCLIKEDV